MTRTYLLALSLLISSCSSTSPPSAQVDPAHEAFSSLLAQGQRQMETGHPEEALASFRKADQLDRFEVPNYEALVHVAEARRRLRESVSPIIFLDGSCGRRSTGRWKIPAAPPSFTGPEKKTAAAGMSPGRRENRALRGMELDVSSVASCPRSSSAPTGRWP